MPSSVRPSRRSVLAASAALLLVTAGCAQGESGTGSANAGSAGGSTGRLDKLSLDYAYYNPASLVLKDRGWLTEALASSGTTVSWQFSAGSNKANELLRGNAVQLGSTAGAAALLARSNGAPTRIVDVLAQPEWTAVVVGPRSTARTIQDLRGRKVAATLGTDPYFFLLQTLAAAGLTTKDVQVVNLQHADGRTALARGDVDAWMGLDPIMAAAQQEDGDRLIVRDRNRATYSVLNAREDFVAAHPDVLATVLTQYERARAWIEANPAESVAILAKEAKLTPTVATTVLRDRTDLRTDPVPGNAQRAVLTRLLPTFVTNKQVGSRADAEKALAGLFLPDPVRAAITAAAASPAPAADSSPAGPSSAGPPSATGAS